ncbi:FAD-binding oxidoreductase [Microbacterium sp. PAMC22086]|uniref:NAD(P)/FAD-dependent oxidoreductase n=1 Tax=Microbacterium sp. PAMC22086 TaxID=2861281 RepID=UPI001C628A2E|nr:FAD-dependent oxidoreductase [Microbacterium sp. PAMC22086]QYG11530.1 FAD-binding oxidoreductase [Microbacterium sp. PAMC22086]
MSSPLRVVVIGAGAVGVSIAATLAERGAHVSLIDAGSPGGGTSAATFGWVNSNGKEPASYFEINRLGLEAHHRRAGSGATWLGTAGHIEIADTQEHYDRLRERVERLTARDYPAHWLNTAQAAELLPGIRIPSGAELIAHFPRETYAYPSLYIASALHRARAAGAVVIANNAVTELGRSTRSGAEIRLADGTVVTADIVISAAGRWTSDLTSLAGVQTPIQQHEGPGDVTVGYLVETLPAPILLEHIVTTPSLNLRPEGGGRLMLQALDLDETADPAAAPPLDSPVVDEFLRRLRTVAIGGEFARPARARVGQRVIPADGHTIAGPSPDQPWLYVVATHSGITLAPFLGEAVADEVNGIERAELASFRLDRFTREPVLANLTAPRRPGEQ